MRSHRMSITNLMHTMRPMNTTRIARSFRKSLAALAALAIAVVAAGTCACAATTNHPTAPAALGVVSDVDKMEALLSTPGPITLESIDSAQWSVPLSGLLNLNHPTAKAAHLEDKPECSGFCRSFWVWPSSPLAA